jgi:general secretion pathway protein K
MPRRFETDRWRRPLADQRGIALLIVLVIVTLLVAAVVEFTHGTKLAITTAANYRNGIQAVYLAKSGVTAARAVLKEDAKTSGAVDDLTELWATPLPPYSVGDGAVAVEIADEAGKISLGELFEPNTKDKVKGVLEGLFRNLQIDPQIAVRIRDYIDADTSSELGGEESSYRNARVDSLTELLNVPGVTPEIYLKIAPYLTLTDAWPINVNTASAEVLRALHGEMTDEYVQTIINGRPHENLDVLGRLPDHIRTDIRSKRLLGWKSNYFSVRAVGSVHETTKTARALVKRSGSKVALLSWQVE